MVIIGGYPWGKSARDMNNWSDLEVYDMDKGKWTTRKSYSEQFPFLWEYMCVVKYVKQEEEWPQNLRQLRPTLS